MNCFTNLKPEETAKESSGGSPFSEAVHVISGMKVVPLYRLLTSECAIFVSLLRVFGSVI